MNSTHSGCSEMLCSNTVIRLKCVTDRRIIFVFYLGTAVYLFLQLTVAIWILSSLIMVNLWTADRVTDLSLLRSAASSPTPGPGGSCLDRLCLVTEAASGQVWQLFIGMCMQSFAGPLAKNHQLLKTC